jgi:hypothetical protein
LIARKTIWTFAVCHAILLGAHTQALKAQNTVIPTDVSYETGVGTADWADDGWVDRGDWMTYPDSYTGVENTWAIQAEALILTRSRARNQQLLFNDNATPAGIDDDTQLLSTRDFKMDYQPGFRIGAGRMFDDNLAFEMTYAQVKGLNATKSFRSGGDLRLPLAPGTTTDYQQSSANDFDYNSDFYSLELNVRKQLTEEWGWLTGFRYLGIDDKFRASSNNFAGDGLASLYEIGASNDMFGLQIGSNVRTAVLTNLTLDFDILAGLYANRARQRTNAVDDGGVPYRAFRARDDDMAFVGELRLSAVYALTDHVSFRLGYQILWAAGIAMAPDQFDWTATPSAGSRINNNATAYYHGLNIGLEFVR